MVRPRFSGKMERFLRLFNSGLKLSESEKLEVVISDTATERLRVWKFFLVGKVLTQKYLRSNIAMGVIKDLWRLKANVEATAIGNNRILFSFNSEEELRLVLKGSPWFFRKSLLLLAEVKGLQVPVDVPLREPCFWARIHGLPSAFMTRKMGEIIGVALGRCVQVECVNDFCFWEFMRIRVSLDVFKPLRRGVHLRLPSSEGGALIGVLVQYERLPSYCFFVGCSIISVLSAICLLEELWMGFVYRLEDGCRLAIPH